MSPTGPTSLPGVDVESWLIEFDKLGACTSPVARRALLERMDTIGNRPVILFSHGWNNEFSAATDLYAGFMKQLAALRSAYPADPREPLFVGVVWPSTWLSWDTGPRIASAAGAEPSGAERDIGKDIAAPLAAIAQRDRLYELLESPPLGDGEADELAGLVATSLAEAPELADRDGAEPAAADKETLLTAWKAVQSRLRPPDSQTELEEGGTIGGPVSGVPLPAGLLNMLDPRTLIRLASVWQMKDRAGTVGFNGVARLLEDMLSHSRGPVHAVGHSYGCKVVLSAVAGATGRKVRSLLLLQPAVSHLCFAADGGYRGVRAKVEMPILSTYSAHDFPLHEIFHLALRRKDDLRELRIAAGPTAAGMPPNDYAALGGYGPRGAGEELRQPLPAPQEVIPIPAAATIIGLDGTVGNKIRSHGDVVTASTAWLLHRQLAL